jgi:hypothetical protein
MDVDSSEFASFSLKSMILNCFSDARASSLPVRLLPFSLVPGIAINSRPFLKAVSVIAKQQETSTNLSRVGNTSSSTSVSKGKKNKDLGTSHTFLFQTHCLNYIIY